MLIGRGGLFALELATAPQQDDGPLLETLALAAPGRFNAAASAVHALGISPAAIQSLIVVPDRRLDRVVHTARVVGENNLHHLLLGLPKRLAEPEVEMIRTRLDETVPAYTSLEVAKPDGEDPRSPGRPAEPDTLFDLADVEAAMQASVLAASVEKWMTFLGPQQAKLVSRTFNGPARISGPAGTGKTVIGLHRAIHLARRSTRRVLFVTFASNLPRVHHNLARTISPEAADRIDFTTLHKFALDILKKRDIPVRLRHERAESLASRAWQNVGAQALGPVAGNARYWLDEIDYVIKGRMISDLAAYRLAERRGRRLPLRAQDREAVWAMYEEYERLRRAEGVSDFNDVLAMALAEVDARPLDPAYAGVIVDEVQDLTLTGIRLLHSVAGDGPNGLLLIGDGQQAVYPGGYRLSEAGITVPGGRGVALTTNYRNRAEILEAALKVVAQYTFEDIDESTVSGHRSVETTMDGGVVTSVELPSIARHDNALIEAMRDVAGNATGTCFGDLAVLCPNNDEVDRYDRTLRRAGIPTISLRAYDGSHINACKIGTYTRGKGLDFKHVFIPRQELAVPTLGRSRDPDGADRESTELAVRRLYVAMTRARDSLWIGTVSPACAS